MSTPTAPGLPDGLRSLMATFPTGVAVVTTVDEDSRPWGLTCSSVVSVALSPPTLLICVRDGSPTLRALLRRSQFAVNLLHDAAQPTAELFASGQSDRFDRIRWRHDRHHAGPHLVEDAHAIADCYVTSTIPVGDHVVVFGEVVRIEHDSSDEPSPLLYGLRRYSSWSVERANEVHP
jgi:flavin reductase (DIM6/NTAB) family NADH-FMN oxidoreductase RutF